MNLRIGTRRSRLALAQAEEVARKVGARALALQVELDAPERINVLEETTAIQVRDRKRQVQSAGMGGVGAFALVVLAVALLEFRARRVSGTADISRGLGIRLIGTLPLMSGRATRRRDSVGEADADVVSFIGLAFLFEYVGSHAFGWHGAPDSHDLRSGRASGAAPEEGAAAIGSAQAEGLPQGERADVAAAAGFEGQAHGQA